MGLEKWGRVLLESEAQCWAIFILTCFHAQIKL